MATLSKEDIAAQLAKLDIDYTQANPYLHVFSRLEPQRRSRQAFNMGRFDCWQQLAEISYERAALITEFACAVPTDEALGVIKDNARLGIVSIGAGSGYWEHLLAKAGVDVIAYDLDPFPSPTSFAQRV